MKRFSSPFSDIIAYCLIPNHFHLLLKVKAKEDLPVGIRHKEDLPDGRKELTIDQSLKNFFNSYTRSYNIVHKRNGRLFQHAYKQKEIDSDEYLLWLIYYIHRNPVHHKLTNACKDWTFSSYNEIIDANNIILSDFIFNLYGNKKEFIELTSDLIFKYNKNSLSQKYSKLNIEFE